MSTPGRSDPARLHPDFAAPLGPTTFIVQADDGTHFHFKMSLLAELSVPLQDMWLMIGGNACAIGDNTGDYPCIPIPDISGAGLAFALTVIRNIISGRPLESMIGSNDTYVSALEFARKFEIPILQTALISMARSKYAKDPYGLLAMLAVCGTPPPEADMIAAITTHFAPNMPQWARNVIRHHNPDLLIRIMELSARQYAARDALRQAVSSQRRVVEVPECCMGRKCRADVPQLAQRSLDELVAFATKAKFSEPLEGPDAFIHADGCQQCLIELRSYLWPVVSAYEAFRVENKDAGGGFEHNMDIE